MEINSGHDSTKAIADGHWRLGDSKAVSHVRLFSAYQCTSDQCIVFGDHLARRVLLRWVSALCLLHETFCKF